MQPLFFEPDPEIQDSDLLGIGDLIYDDGRREYVPGDPELASMFDRPPAANEGAMAPLLSPGQYTPEELAGPPPVIDTEQGPMQVGPQGFTPANSLALEDPTLPPMEPMGGEQPGEMGIQAVGANQPELQGPGAPPPLLDPSSGYTPEQLSGPPPILETAQGPMQVTPQGMVPYQREGALPPDVAAEQMGQLGAQQSATLQASEQARAEESRLMQEYTAQRMAEVEAERMKREQEIQEQQAKVERWNGERQQLADMDIETDLISARGPIGAMFGVLGAALLGAVGSDAGLRMIDKAIDTNVREQVRRRDTKLGILGEQIQNTQQAMAMGKAKLYEALANRAELMAQKTKNDIYEAQTPAIIEGLRQKQIEQMQAAEQESLGKLIERAPAPPPPVPLAARRGYGEAAAIQSEGERNVTRALNAIGGKFDPKTGRITNRDEILKKGIPGVGSWDTFISDLGNKLPWGLGEIPRAADTAVTSQEGLDVRSALQALIEAESARINPGKAPTDADRSAAARALGLNSEKGVIDALERSLNSFERTRAQNIATYGEQAAGAVEGTMGALGQRQQTQTAPAEYQPLEPGNARQQLQQERARGKQAPQGPTSSASPEDLKRTIEYYADQEGLNPEGIARVIGHESGGKTGAVNQTTKKHGGLIQFSRETWDGLAKEMGTGVSWDDMLNLSAEEQMPYVVRYFKRLGLGPDDDPGQYALGAFFPRALNEPDDFVIGRKGSQERLGGLSMGKIWQQNPGLRNGDTITAGDARRSVL